MSVSMALVGANTRVFWGPKDLGASLVGWWDASVSSSLTTSGSSVTQWNDLSSSGYHATQSTGANQPTVSGSKISFSGGKHLQTSMSASTVNRFFAIVGSMDGANVDTLAGPSNGGGLQFRGNNGTSQLNKSNVYYFGPGPSYTKTAQSIFTLNLTSTNFVIGVNGTESGTTHSQTMTAGLSQYFGTWYLNGSNQTTEGLDGSINEIIASESLTQANRQRIEGYLAHKWGLTSSLPATHPYKSVAP